MGVKVLTDEQRLARKETLKRYNASAKRRANSKRYESSVKGGKVRRKSRNKRMEKLRALYGSACMFCRSTKQLQFAHIKQTKFHGCMSGGGHARMQDITENLSSYRLLCKMCHYNMGGPEGWKDLSILRAIKKWRAHGGED